MLAEPPRQGLNWLAYIVPPAAFLIGAYLLYRGFQNWHQPLPADLHDIVADDLNEEDEYISRLEEELQERGGDLPPEKT